MSEGISQKAEGNVGLIQIAELKDSFVLQIINGVRAPKDLDQAIPATQKHIDNLQWQKGCRDGRIFFMAGTTAALSAAIFRWDLWSIALTILGIIFVYLGRKNDQYVTGIDTQIAAASAVLVEFYKQKISHQMDGGQ